MTQRWFEKAVAQLERDLEEGRISLAEFNREMRELQWEYREAEEEACRRARAALDEINVSAIRADVDLPQVVIAKLRAALLEAARELDASALYVTRSIDYQRFSDAAAAAREAAK